MTIDSETRKKVIEFRAAGNTNTKIREKTGLSLPSIRKILREEGTYSFSGSRVKPLHVSGWEEGDDIFIVNLTWNYPYRDYSTLQRLRNGVPSWDLSRLLKEIYPSYIVERIVEDINLHGGSGGIYQVTVSRGGNRHVEVTPLVFNNYLIKQLVT